MNRLDRLWHWVDLYQGWLGRAIHPENRRTALRYLTVVVICFDRAERAQ